MSLLAAAAVLMPTISGLLDKLIPDPESRAKAQLDLMRLQQEGAFKEIDAQLQVNLAQAEINKVEAASQNGFQSLGRPLCLMACAAGLWYQFLIRPIAPWVLTVSGVDGIPELPSLDESLMELTFAMLGLGTLRTADRWKRISAIAK